MKTGCPVPCRPVPVQSSAGKYSKELEKREPIESSRRELAIIEIDLA